MTSVAPPPVRHPARHPALRPATMMASCRLGGVPRRTKVDISINLAVMPTRCVLTNSIIAKAESATSFSCASCGMCRPLAAYPQTNQAPHLPGPLAFSIVIRDQRVMATYISLRVALLAVVAAVCTSSAAGLACCPTCNGNNGECYVSDEMYATFAKGGDCLNACPGRYAPSCRWAGCACVRAWHSSLALTQTLQLRQGG